MSRTLLAIALLTSGCTLDGFLFSPVAVDGYDFDGVDENLDGELTDPHPSLIDADHREEGFVSAGGNEIHWVFARNDAPDATTILYSHGTSRNLGRYWDRVELLWQLGFHVLIYDYPGYGRSTGTPDEAGVFAAAEAVRNLLPGLDGVDVTDVVYMGYSLGGGPTYELATQEGLLVQPRAVISEATFCSVEALVQDGSFLDWSDSMVASARFDNCARIAELDVPVLILHGAEDDFVVPRHAEMLRVAARTPPTVVYFEGADHSDIPLVDRAGYEAAIVDFVTP